MTFNCPPTPVVLLTLDRAHGIGYRSDEYWPELQILQRVWGPEYSGEAQMVRTFVKKLRQKLGDDASKPRYIFTEPRVRLPNGQALAFQTEATNGSVRLPVCHTGSAMRTVSPCRQATPWTSWAR